VNKLQIKLNVQDEKIQSVLRTSKMDTELIREHNKLTGSHDNLYKYLQCIEQSMKGLACRVDNLQKQLSKQVAITGELTEVLQMHDKFLPKQKNPSAHVMIT
jgi:hypothetical protein